MRLRDVRANLDPIILMRSKIQQWLKVGPCVPLELFRYNRLIV